MTWKNTILLIVYFSSFINIISSTAISFSSNGEGYTINDNILTITTEGEYDLSSSQTDKKILVSCSCTLNLNSFSLSNNGYLTPLEISSGFQVQLFLEGESSLTDSTNNENEGVIYLQSGASLIISGTGKLNIHPNKLMAINGTDSTSLTVNEGATINIQSSSGNVGGIYLRSSIIFNNAIFTYSCENGQNHALDSEGTIKIIKGTFNINSGDGKGIQSENYLYIGEENGQNSDLTLNINTKNEGIEAKKIEIYSGNINIVAGEDGINAASSGTDCDEETVKCSGNCACYIIYKGGKMTLTSGEDGLDSNGDITISGGEIIIFASSDGADQPIDQDGLLQITGGTVLAAWSTQMGGVSGQTTQTAKIYVGTINKGIRLIAKDNSNNEIISINTPKAANYLYFNYQSSFTITLDGVEVTLSDPSQSQGGPGQGGPGGPGGQMPPGWGGLANPEDNSELDENEDSESNGYFLKRMNIIMSILILIN